MKSPVRAVDYVQSITIKLPARLISADFVCQEVLVILLVLTVVRYLLVGSHYTSR